MPAESGGTRRGQRTNGQLPNQRTGWMGLSGGNTTKSTNWKPSTGYTNAASIADAGPLSSGAKYQLAVQMAKDKFNDDENVNKMTSTTV